MASMYDIVFIGTPGNIIPCPQCGGDATLVHKTLLDMAGDERPSGCVVSYWSRDGLQEDAGVCMTREPVVYGSQGDIEPV